MEEKRLSPEEKVAFLKKMSEGKKAKASTKGRSPNQGVKLLYIRDYLHKQTNKEHPKNATEISDYLATKGIKADRKTIYNDILRLQVEFQEPIDYHPNKKGYYIAEPTFSLYELQMLMDSVRSSKFLSVEEVSSMCKRIAGLTNIYDQSALTEIPAYEDVFTRPVVGQTEKATIIQQAIRENKKISFRYFGYYPTDNNRTNHGKTYFQSIDGNEVHIVSPKELIVHNNQRVLVCYRNDPRMEEVTDFVYLLDCMEDVEILPSERECVDIWEPTKENRVPLFEYAAKRFLEDGFWDGMLDPDGERDFEDESERKYDWIRDMLIAYEDEWVDIILNAQPVITITLLFKKEDAQEILAEFGHDVVLVPAERDYCRLTFHRPLTRHFFEWLFTMRDRVRIVTPFEIQELYKKYVGNIQKAYEYWDMPHVKLMKTFIDVLMEKVTDEDLRKKLAKYKIETTSNVSFIKMLMEAIQSGIRIRPGQKRIFGLEAEIFWEELAREYVFSTSAKRKELEKLLKHAGENLLQKLEASADKILINFSSSDIDDFLKEVSEVCGVAVDELWVHLAKALGVPYAEVKKVYKRVYYLGTNQQLKKLEKTVKDIAEKLYAEQLDNTEYTIDDVLGEFARMLSVDRVELLRLVGQELGTSTEEVQQILADGSEDELNKLGESLLVLLKKFSPEDKS